jgi:hypothetical protein
MLAFSFADDQRLCEEDAARSKKKQSAHNSDTAAALAAQPTRGVPRGGQAVRPCIERAPRSYYCAAGLFSSKSDRNPGIPLQLYCAPAVSGLHTYQIIKFPSFGHAAKHLPT